MCFLAGGGMKTGQVIGSTSRYAEEAKNRPVHLQEIFATLYCCLGIDVATEQIIDPNGRPQYLLERRQVIQELVEAHSFSSVHCVARWTSSAPVLTLNFNFSRSR